MLTNAEVLARLGNWLSPGDLAAVLGKLLRVPEAWEQLHDVQFLEDLLNTDTEKNLLPASMAIRMAESTEYEDPVLPQGDLESQMAALWNESERLPSTGRGLSDVTRLASGLKQISLPPIHPDISNRILSDPKLWASPLACAWPGLESGIELLISLVSQENSTGLFLCLNTILTNHTLDEAAGLLSELTQGIPQHVLYLHLSRFEPDLLKAFSNHLQSPDQPGELYLPQESPEAQLSTAIMAQLHGDYDLAVEHLDLARERSTAIMAQVMDQRAQIACATDQLDDEIGARREAIAIQSTVERVANLALLHARNGDFTEAMAILPADPQHLAEKVATGFTLYRTGEEQQAHEILLAAVEDDAIIGIDCLPWLLQLFELLKEMDEIDSAIMIARIRSELSPADVNALIDYAQILCDAGDPTMAIESAYLAFALSPNSSSARQVLATCLQEAGNPTEALAHWAALSEGDSSLLPSVTQCALEAGFADLARDIAQEMLDLDPQSVKGQVLLGQALALGNDVESALQILQKATEENPDHPETWIALAACQEQKGDLDTVGHTLATAIQMIPENAELLMTYANWLELRGRNSEALEIAERANGIKSKSFDYEVAYGNLLRKLGHYEQALPILQKAVRHKPYRWQGLHALALVYDVLGDSYSVSQTMKHIPDSAPTEAHLLAAKANLRVAREYGEVYPIRAGKRHLEHALSQGSNDEAHIVHLQAQVHELEGDYQQALDCYTRSAERTDPLDQELCLESALGIARSALAMEQFPLAISKLEEVQARHPNYVPMLTLLAEAYALSGQDMKALETIEYALKIEPTNRQALKQISVIASRMKTWSPAMHALRKTVDLNPQDARAWVDFAENAWIVGNGGESRNVLAQALRLGRKDPFILSQSADVLQQMKGAQSALRLLRRALRMDPENISILKKTAETAENAGDFEAALQAWSRYTELVPHDKQALLSSARVLWGNRQRSSAIELWRRAIKLEPNDVTTIDALAQAYVAEGNVHTALALYTKAMNEFPEDIEIALEASRMALRVGDMDRAFEILSDLLRRAPKQTEVLLTLAECLIERDQPAKALEVLDSVIVEDAFPAKWFALVSIATCMVGDVNRAIASLEEGMQFVDLERDEALLLSRASLALNRWADTLQILSRDTFEMGDHERILAEIQTRIRASELSSLYLIAEAHRHAPPPSLIGEDSLDEIDRLLSMASHLPIQKILLDQLSMRLKLFSMKGEIDRLEDHLLVARQDQSGESLEAIALAFLRLDRPQEALNIMALRDETDIEGAWFDLIAGICQMKLKRLTLAREAFRNVKGNATQRPLALLLEAQTLLEEEKASDAKVILNEAVTAWSDEPVWQYRLGTLYLEENDLDSALPHFQQAAELVPENDEYRLMLARILRDTGHLSQAYAHFCKALESAPDDGQIWFEAGSLALAMGDAQHAEGFFSHSCLLAPSDPNYLVGAARASLALGNIKDALERVKNALRISPDHSEALIAAGEILAGQGKFDKAILSYERAIPKAPDPTPIQLARIRLLAQAGRASEAVPQTKTLIEQYPDDEKMWAAHAEACEAAGDVQQALDAAAKAIKLSPHTPAYRLLLGRLSRKAGQLDRALDELSRLERLDPTNTPTLLEMGHLLEDRRQYGEALNVYRRTIQYDQDLAEAYFRAGLVLKQLKSYSEAGSMLRKAVELEPNNPDAHHQLAAVSALELVHGGIPQMAVSI
jgi:tetratricopeptide (TPR) repeat protein